MFDDYGKQLLKSGIIDAKAGDRQSARRYLDRAVYISNDHDVLAEAWFWMSEVLDDPSEKRKALENCLAHDLQHARARRALAILDGKLKADEIIDPDNLPPAPARSACCQCRAIHVPQMRRADELCAGWSVACLRILFPKPEIYCPARNRAGKGLSSSPWPLPADMASRSTSRSSTAKDAAANSSCRPARSPSPVSIAALRMLSTGNRRNSSWRPMASSRMPSTRSAPTKFWANGCDPTRSNLRAECEPPRGVYLPLWTFDLGGEIDYVGETVDQDDLQFGRKRPKMVRVNDSYPVQINDLPIPASRKLSAVFLRLIPSFELRGIKPYDPRYLANWPAEVYDIPMAEASLDARVQGLSRYKRDLPGLLDPIKVISTSSAKMTVESFRLNLLPVWVTEIPFGGRQHLVLINGQNGTVASDLPGRKKEEKGLMDWLGELLNS